MDFEAVFGRGPRQLGNDFCRALDDFGCLPGFKKETIVKLASLFYLSDLFATFCSPDESET